MILFDAPYVTIHGHYGPDCTLVEWKGFVFATAEEAKRWLSAL